MNYERIYIQYNDIVFDGFDMLYSYEETNTSFKVTTHSRSFGHGSYAPFKSSTSYVDETNVSITLRLNEKKLPCEHRPFYRSFVVSELMKHGKLWAVQDNTLVWAYATVTEYSEMVEHLNGILTIDVDFLLYEGIWHKADKQKTFLHPYDICTFIDCYDFEELNPCVDAELVEGCCECLIPVPEPLDVEDCCNCDCNTLTKDMALCYHKDELQDFYKKCVDHGFRVVYDCEAAERFFGRIGQSICVGNCQNGLIAGKIYSETDIPTDKLTITLVGKMHDPYIEINGNGNYISGDYDGTLVITPSGDVYFENGCCADDPLDVSVWKIPEGMNFGWKIVPRNNRVVINLGACCGKACAYFDIDNITI